jgi:excisionase family DNA binding protein
MAASAPSATALTHEPLLDAPQAAAQLAVSTRWLEDSARAGIIPHHKFGRFIRFRVSEVAAHCRFEGAAIP